MILVHNTGERVMVFKLSGDLDKTNYCKNKDLAFSWNRMFGKEG